MTKDEIMNLVDRSLFATIGYTDELGRQNAEGGRYYRYDGIGDLSASEIEELSKNKVFENRFGAEK